MEECGARGGEEKETLNTHLASGKGQTRPALLKEMSLGRPVSENRGRKLERERLSALKLIPKSLAPSSFRREEQTLRGGRGSPILHLANVLHGKVFRHPLLHKGKKSGIKDKGMGLRDIVSVPFLR